MRTQLLAPFLVSSLALAVAAPSDADIILNGDFEDNTATSSIFNLSNASYNVVVADSTAFGLRNEIDLVTGGDLGIDPQSGDWEVELNETGAQGTFDALSLVLSVPVVSGNSYSLEFFVGKSGTADIGLSSVATDQGSVIFSGASTGASGEWTQYNHTFTAAENASFLTVAASLGGGGKIAMDNISLTQVPEPSTALLIGLGIIGAGVQGRRRRR